LRLLALETSARNASVAMLENQLDTPAFSESADSQLEELAENGPMTAVDENAQESASQHPNPESPHNSPFSKRRQPSSSVTLIRTIQQALAEKGWAPTDVDVVAVTVGPGSFTGLRIGLVTAKTFAYAAKARVVGVNTLEVIASQTRSAMPQASPDGHFKTIKVAIDAGRNQLFVGQYAFDREPSQQGLPDSAFHLEEKSTWLRQIGSDEIATGPALFRMQQELIDLKNEESNSFNVAPESCWTPTAMSVGLVGATKFLATDDDLIDEHEWWKLSPLYMRPSYAEE